VQPLEDEFSAEAGEFKRLLDRYKAVAGREFADALRAEGMQAEIKRIQSKLQERRAEIRAGWNAGAELPGGRRATAPMACATSPATARLRSG
jgi:hypothetical protein